MLLGDYAKRILPQRPGTALLVKGGPGIGKTEVTEAYFKRQDWAVAKFVAAQETPESVAGFLWIDSASGSCSYKPQRRLAILNQEIQAGKNAVLIIDEFKGGDRMVHNALQQLIREHQVGDWIAAGKMYVVALTNREEDRANVVRLTAPMINRFVQVTVEADFDYWRSWANQFGLVKEEGKDFPRVHPDILGWLSAVFIGGQRMKTEQAKEWAKDKSLLFCSPAPVNEVAFPTPRSHELASDILYKFGGEDESFLREVLAGAFGDGPAFEFCAWHKIGKEANDHVDQIVNGGKLPGVLDVGMQFFVNAQLASRFAQDSKRIMTNVLKYLYDGLESEYAMLLIQDLASISDSISKDKDWGKVVARHKKVALTSKR